MNVITPLLITASIVCGFASRYDQLPTDATLDYRLEMGEAQTGYPVYIARPDCSEIGLEYWVEYGNGWQLSQVFDCAVRDDSDGALSWMTNNNILVELDYYSAASVGFDGYGLIPVCIAPVAPEMAQGVPS